MFQNLLFDSLHIPHIYCFQALDGLMSGKNVSSWTYQGKSIPFIEVDNNIFFADQKKDNEQGIPFGFLSTYRKSIEKAAIINIIWNCYLTKIWGTLPIPYVLPLYMTLRMPLNGGMSSIGETVEGNIEGQVQSFKRTISFFQEP